jgi:hypothetical protein
MPSSNVFNVNGKCIHPHFGRSGLGEATKTAAAKTRLLLLCGVQSSTWPIGRTNYLYLSAAFFWWN